MPSSPWPQALQAAPARPGPPLLAPSRRAGTRAHTSRRSRERGLGQTQSLRSRSNVAVQQVLGTPPGRGQAPRRQLTCRGTRVLSTQTETRHPIPGARKQGPRPCPAVQMGPPRPRVGQEPPSNPGWRWHEADTRAQGGGTSAPSHTPGAVGERLTPRRTSQKGCSATNRMWPASQRHSPRTRKMERGGRGETGYSWSPDPGWPQFPHLYNGSQWGAVMPGSEDSHCPESQPILATPNATHRQLCPQQAKHSPQAPPSAHCADGDQMLQPCGSGGGGGRAQRAGRRALGLAQGPIISSCPSDPGPGLTLGAVVSWPAVATAAIFGSLTEQNGGVSSQDPPETSAL